MDSFNTAYAPFEQEDAPTNATTPEIEPIVDTCPDPVIEPEEITEPEPIGQNEESVDLKQDSNMCMPFFARYWYFIVALIILLIAYFKDSMF